MKKLIIGIFALLVIGAGAFLFFSPFGMEFGNDKPQTDSKSSATDTQETGPAAEVKKEYKPEIQELETDANQQVNQLAKQAYDEYKQKKANGEDVSLLSLYSEYKGEADKLEAETDKEFNKIYNQLVEDLEAQGIDPSKAEEIKWQYEQSKEERKDQLMKKAMDSL